MAHFYGTIEGKGGTKASRQGSKASGLEASLMSWGGCLHVEFWHDTETGTDWVRVEGRMHPGAEGPKGARPFPRVLYRGPVEGLWRKPAERIAA